MPTEFPPPRRFPCPVGLSVSLDARRTDEHVRQGPCASRVGVGRGRRVRIARTSTEGKMPPLEVDMVPMGTTRHRGSENYRRLSAELPLGRRESLNATGEAASDCRLGRCDRGGHPRQLGGCRGSHQGHRLSPRSRHSRTGRRTTAAPSSAGDRRAITTWSVPTTSLSSSPSAAHRSVDEAVDLGHPRHMPHRRSRPRRCRRRGRVPRS